MTMRPLNELERVDGAPVDALEPGASMRLLEQFGRLQQKIERRNRVIVLLFMVAVFLSCVVAVLA